MDLQNRWIPAAYIAFVILALVLYTARLSSNPPGFHLDESSVCYNAFTIARYGQDEFGNSWPLFFRAFGDYKNPIYIYLLSAVFKITGPSILAARFLSASLGILTATLLTLLAVRISRSHWLGILAGLTALLTPWLFEMSRIVLEVALFPFVTSLFLLCLHNASNKQKWSWIDAATLALSLALLSYTYSIGRLLGPLLAVGLVSFWKTARWRALVRTWLLYTLTLIPMLTFHYQHPEALTGRFKLITYISPDSSLSTTAWNFIKYYSGSFDPRKLLFTGDPNIYQVAHVPSMPAVLFPTLLLAAWAIFKLLRRREVDPWRRFLIYGLAVSAIPASLTSDYFHMLRLAAVPVFLLVLAAEALSKMNDKKWGRFALMAVLSLTLLQGGYFQWQYHVSTNSPWRRHLFDAEYPEKILAPALAQPMRPIYLDDAITGPYAQAYWYATVWRVPVSEFVRLEPKELPPVGALVITTKETIHGEVLAQVDPYRLYISAETAEDRVRPSERR